MFCFGTACQYDNTEHKFNHFLGIHLLLFKLPMGPNSSSPVSSIYGTSRIIQVLRIINCAC